MNDPVHLTREGGIAVCRLDRPPVNAIDVPLSMALETVLGDLAGDEELDAVILTGTGRCFSAGLDLKHLPHYSREEQDALLSSLNRLLYVLYSFPRPVIAAVNGHAIAGGYVLMLASDYRIGADGDGLFGLAVQREGPCGLELRHLDLGAGIDLSDFHALDLEGDLGIFLRIKPVLADNVLVAGLVAGLHALDRNRDGAGGL